MPNSKNAEENAPSRKYFIAASCEISRRRRARPHSRYSGSEKTSSATNSTSRSLAEANSIMPPTANSVSGKTSVCSTRAAVPSRSASDPGTAAAWPANADSPPSTDRSANSSTLISVSPSRRIQVNSAGPSTEIAPWAAITSLSPPIRMAVSTPATTRATTVIASCTRCRNCRGRNASTRTPTHAAPKTTSSGASSLYSILGAVKSASGRMCAITSVPPSRGSAEPCRSRPPAAWSTGPRA